MPTPGTEQLETEPGVKMEDGTAGPQDEAMAEGAGGEGDAVAGPTPEAPETKKKKVRPHPDV